MNIVIIILNIAILLTLLDINDKLKIETKENNKKIDLSHYQNKKVYITLNNENVEDSYLFSEIIGEITDYDDKWFIFEYHNRKQTIKQYLKIKDLKSISEIK